MALQLIGGTNLEKKIILKTKIGVGKNGGIVSTFTTEAFIEIDNELLSSLMDSRRKNIFYFSVETNFGFLSGYQKLSKSNNYN